MHGTTNIKFAGVFWGIRGQSLTVLLHDVTSQKIKALSHFMVTALREPYIRWSGLACHAMKGLNSLNGNDNGFVSTDFSTLLGTQ